MIIRVVSLQVVRYWEIIKFSLQQTERIGVDQSQAKFNSVLAALLSDKAQCFIKHNDEGVQGVMITEIIENRIEGTRELNIQSLYIFNPLNVGEWESYFPMVQKLAKKCKCESICFNTNHPKLVQLAKGLGFKQGHVNMNYKLLGG